MSTSEYLAFIPLLLYGIGLTDLLGEWKRLFDPKSLYLPYLLVTIMLTETAIFNVFMYFDIVKQLEDVSYMGYLKFLVSPFLFVLAVNAFTPDSEVDTKTYFSNKMSLFFSLLAALISSYFLYDTSLSTANALRIAMALLLIAVAIFKRITLVYIVFSLWAVTIFLKAFL